MKLGFGKKKKKNTGEVLERRNVNGFEEADFQGNSNIMVHRRADLSEVDDILSEGEELDDGFEGFDGFGKNYDNGLGFKTNIKKPKASSSFKDEASKPQEAETVEANPERGYNKKLQKKDKSIPKYLFFLKWSKKKKIIVGAALGVFLVIVIAVATRGDKDNFYSIMSDTVTREKGTFRYVLDIQRELVEEGKTGQLKELDMSGEAPTEGTDGNAVSGEAVKGTSDANLSDSWSKSDGSTVDESGFPNCKVIIEGCTINNTPEKVESSVDVSIITDNINQKFTNITIKDGFIYYDTELMRKWLSNSKDSFCVGLAKDIPENAKFIKQPLKDFKVKSGWSEDNEVECAIHPIQWWRGITSTFKKLTETLSKLGKTGITKNEGTYNLAINGETGAQVLNQLKGMLVNRDNIFKNTVADIKQNGALSDKQYQQLLNSEDNFLSATDEFCNNLTTVTPKEANLQLKGMAKRYKNTNNRDCVECSLTANITVDGINYNISFGAMNTGEGREITVPTGSESTMSADDYSHCLGLMIGHYNPTSIDIYYPMDTTTDRGIAASTLLYYKKAINDALPNKPIHSIYEALPFIMQYSITSSFSDMPTFNGQEGGVEFNGVKQNMEYYKKASEVVNKIVGSSSFATLLKFYGGDEAVDKWSEYQKAMEQWTNDLNEKAKNQKIEINIGIDPTKDNTTDPVDTTPKEPTNVTKYYRKIEGFMGNYNFYLTDIESNKDTVTMKLKLEGDSINAIEEIINKDDFCIVAETGEIYRCTSPDKEIRVSFTGNGDKDYVDTTLTFSIPQDKVERAKLYYQNRLDLGDFILDGEKSTPSKTQSTKEKKTKK